jgi:hypothetical protein
MRRTLPFAAFALAAGLSATTATAAEHDWTSYCGRDTHGADIKATVAALKKLAAVDDCARAWDKLVAMEAISLKAAGVQSTAPLAGLTAVKDLDLSENALTDLSGVSTLTQLKKLDLAQTGLKDVAALAGLKELTQLRLSGNEITEVAGLAGLSKLKKLWVNNNKVANMNPLAALAGLDEVEIKKNPINLERCPTSGKVQVKIDGKEKEFETPDILRDACKAEGKKD